MLHNQYIANISEYIYGIEAIACKKGQTILFRGQDCNAPLIPKISRVDPSTDTSARECQMLHELERRTARNPALLGQDKWDALVVAQHFGMSTRLLDWTTNPLIALWFAISNLKETMDGYIYMLRVTDELLLDRKSEPDPFDIHNTYVFKPSINNERLAAQAGWFTAHGYSRKSKQFVDLHKNTALKHRVLMRGIHGYDKKAFMNGLERLGVHHESLFPGLEGTCKYVDRMFLDAS